MPRYRCPHCQGPPVRLRRRRGRHPLCRQCGSPLSVVPANWTAPALAIGAAGFCVLVAATPDLLDGAVRLSVGSTILPRVLESFEPTLEPHEQPTALLEGDLFEDLAAADRQWIPRAEHLPDGSIRYHYKRRLGDPELSIGELRHRMHHPPNHDAERMDIQELLKTLQQANVRLLVANPKKPGAAGEWDHASRTLRVDPTVLDKGTVEFAKVLNHEAIHVAQSCAAGALRAPPRLLGLPTRVDSEVADQLNDPLYAGASTEERRMELEAYANQHLLSIGDELIRAHCRLG